jgi:hypothetical protein
MPLERCYCCVYCNYKYYCIITQSDISVIPCIDISVRAKADSNAIDGKRNGALVIPNAKKQLVV